ncbi:daptide-type RiPP biosynthesis aminotransferase [Streptomyces sp. AGS-58]|uniref:daptide-type RiPP biosynthesis aminotransferase n=1 Tax=unclassified Streptomyces TaxID=2593676 RepID=UPI0035A3CFC6
MTDRAGRYPLWEPLHQPSRFGRRSHSAVRAEGTKVLFADGRWRQCGTSGLWNVNLGYGNRRVAEAVRTALLEASYFSLFRTGHEPAVAASRALLDLSGPDWFGRVAHTTSGGSANDLVMKLVRQYWSLRRQFRRRVVVGLKGSYHGLTYGSHGLTGTSLGQSYYSVDQRLIRHVSHQDITELEELLQREGEQVAAVVVEPVLGTGAYPLSPQMLEGLERLRVQYGFLLVADEVATGFGRTGPCFASLNWTRPPDVLLASKGLTNGTCAAAAVIVCHDICDLFDRHDAVLTHAETQAGTPATCAAILATLEEMERLRALDAAAEVGRRLDALFVRLADHPLVAGSDGAGCFRALRLAQHGTPLGDDAVTAVLEEIREAGALLSPGPSCVQLAPALVYDDEDMAQLEKALVLGLDRAAERLPALEEAPS